MAKANRGPVQKNEAAAPPKLSLGVEVVGGAEPCFQLGVDVGGRRDFDAMCDSIFFGEAASVNQAFGEFALVGGEAEARSMRALVVGLIWANTCSRYRGTMVKL
jgi:hypothetical protein